MKSYLLFFLLIFILNTLITHSDAQTYAETECYNHQSQLFCKMKFGDEFKAATAVITHTAKNKQDATLKTHFVVQYLCTKEGDGPNLSKKEWGAPWSSKGFKFDFDPVYDPNKGSLGPLKGKCSSIESLMNLKEGKYFVRAQLASPRDYTKLQYQKATYHHINAIPMWGPFHTGNWKQGIEAKFHLFYGKTKGNMPDYYAKSYPHGTYEPNYRVVTGVYGQMTCSKDDSTPLFLQHNGIKVPIPKLVYKAIHSWFVLKGEKPRKPVLLVMVNDPRMTKGEIEKDPELHLCPKKDLCALMYFRDEYQWFRESTFYCDQGAKVKANGIVTKGYTYVCELTPELQKKLGFNEFVNYLTPRLSM